MRKYRLQVKRDYATETNFKFNTLSRLFEFLTDFYTYVIENEVDKITVKVFVEDTEGSND